MSPMWRWVGDVSIPTAHEAGSSVGFLSDGAVRHSACKLTTSAFQFCDQQGNGAERHKRAAAASQRRVELPVAQGCDDC